ncbi:32384_t:CDS:2, partial [Racocetra persica]
AEPCKEEVNKDGNSLNLLCKKPGHLYQIDLDKCFAHLERFSITREHRPKERDNLFNTPEKIDATSLPPIEAFDSILNKSKCSEKAYKIAQEVWESFDIKTFRDYHDFYLNLDILLLADCLEGFCKLMKEGISMVSNHQVKANNPQYPDFVPESEEVMKKLYTWLLYIDANALYTGAMIQSMPTGGYRWITPDETPDLFNKITKWEISDNAEKGYILEVDLDYPYKLHKAHTSYLLAPENIEISKEEMSKCGQEIINDLKHYTKTKKLIPNLNKKKYIVHYRMKPFMKELARSRTLAKNDFEKNIYKLLGNANYGKTVKNVRKYQRIDFVKPEEESKKFKKLVADPSYKSYRILAENLVGISRHQSKARLSKPIFIDNIEVAYTDTDSFILLIRTENVYKDMAEMHEHFDFSDYKLEYPIYKALRKEKIILNKKVP